MVRLPHPRENLVALMERVIFAPVGGNAELPSHGVQPLFHRAPKGIGIAIVINGFRSGLANQLFKRFIRIALAHDQRRALRLEIAFQR